VQHSTNILTVFLDIGSCYFYEKVHSRFKLGILNSLNKEMISPP